MPGEDDAELKALRSRYVAASKKAIIAIYRRGGISSRTFREAEEKRVAIAEQIKERLDEIESRTTNTSAAPDEIIGGGG